MNWEIESGIAPPKKAHRSKYPWEKMEPGQSVKVPDDEAWTRVYSSAMQYAHRKGQEWRGSRHEKRIWRVA